MKEIEFSGNLPLRIVEDLLERKKDKDFSDVLILIPNKRPAYYITRYLQEKLNSPFFPPQIFSIDEFVRNFALKLKPGVCRIEDLNKSWILFKITRDMGLFSCYDFHNFFVWGLRLADIIDELELEEVDDRKLKNLPSGAIPKEIGNIISHLGEVKKNFYSELKERGLTVRGMDFATVASELNEEILKDFSIIYTGGFFAPTRLEEKILKYLNKLEKNIHFVQKEWKGWNFEKIHLYSAFDVHSEIKGVREILKKGFDPAKTVIVLPQADSLIPLLSLVVGNLKKEYNISMGYPLERTPPYTLLEQVVHFQETKVGKEYYAKDYLSLLLHPYIKNLSLDGSSEETHTFVHQIEAKLSDESSKPFVLLEEIEKEFRGIKEIHVRFIKNIENVRTFSQLSRCFEEIFSFVLTKSPAQFYPFSGEFFEKFFEIFRSMQNSVFANEEMERDDLFDLFRYYVHTVRIPFSGIPLEGLQILGMLETRNLFFEKVIVLDVQEGVIPDVNKYDPIFPMSVRRFLGLSTYAEREKVFRNHFMNLLSTAKEAHLIYREHGKEVRSRFIEEIVWEKEQSAGKVDSEATVRPVSFEIKTITKKPLSIVKNKKILDALKETVFSASSIDKYLNCPAQFYFYSVLGLEEKEGIEREPDSGEIGICIHRILQKFYEPLKDREIILAEEDRLRLEGIVDFEIKEKFGELRGEIYLLNKISKFRLNKFFEKERQRENWKILCTEESFDSVPLDGIAGFDGHLYLKGRIDRIDQRGEKIYIIDYKTGEPKKPGKRLQGPLIDRKEMKMKIKSFQLPVYMHLYRKKNSGLFWKDINAGFYLLNDAKEEFLFSEKDDPEIQMEKIFLPSLKNLIAEIFNPAVNFEKDAEDERYCQYCPYSAFCL